MTDGGGQRAPVEPGPSDRQRPEDPTPYLAARAMLLTLRGRRPPLAGIGYGLAARWDGEPWATDPGEYRAASRMEPQRRREFLLGRCALHRAMADAGLPDTPILMDERNRPRFPQGVTGSLSHSGGFAVALAGASTRFHMIGVDLELSQLPAHAAHLVGTELIDTELIDTELVGADQERAWMSGRNGLGLLAAFSAKEAAFKALDPILDHGAPLPRQILLRCVPRGFLAWPPARPDLILSVIVHPVGTGVLAWTAVIRA